MAWGLVLDWVLVMELVSVLVVVSVLELAMELMDIEHIHMNKFVYLNDVFSILEKIIFEYHKKFRWGKLE